MGWLSVKSLLLLLVLHQNINGNEGCIQEERKALLELKSYLVSNDEEAESMLSWVDDLDSECCNWKRVSCNSTTGHVTQLNLNSVRTVSTNPVYSPPPLLLNASLFLPFKELQSLDLSENELITCCAENGGFERLANLKKFKSLNLAGTYVGNIYGSLSMLTALKTLNLRATTKANVPVSVQELSTLRNMEILDLSGNNFSSFPQKGFEFLSKLNKLRHLNLSKNKFNKDILRFVGALSGLKYLSLERNEMEGSLSSHELVNLSSLEVLTLRRNRLNGTLPIQDLITFRNLRILDLSQNSFIGSIPPYLGALSSLKALSLAQNQLNGSLPIPGLCELNSLQELDLSKNSFQGYIPQCLANLSSLTVLDLSWNQFTGIISSSLISSLTALEFIDLGHNSFNGSFPFSSFSNHSGLKIVDFGNNNLLEVETEQSFWIPNFQLEVLALSNCNLNRHTGDIPKFLSFQNKLKLVDLCHNNLKGTFPYWLLENMKTLQSLKLRNNSLKGQIHLPLHALAGIRCMDLSSNHFKGQLQPNLGMILPNLQNLNLSRNGFEGILPLSICDMNLQRLDLSYNNFSGEVPKQLVGGCSPHIQILKLSSNNFHGEILSPQFNMSFLRILQLNDNKFSGTISCALSKSSQLVKFDASDNYMSGEIPIWTTNITSLESIKLQNNFFRGQFPRDLPSVKYLDLSNNRLSGNLPPWGNLKYIKHIHLQGNKFTGSMPNDFGNLSSLLTLDIRDNCLSGSIPTTVDAAFDLRVLLLSGNHLSGFIPNQLCNLEKISLMDLSRNFLSGPIPSCLHRIAFGKIEANDRVFIQHTLMRWHSVVSSPYGHLLPRTFHPVIIDYMSSEQEEVEFVTKSRQRSYKGDIINFMSGLDLSCNNLTGEIPYEFGELGWIHALNLSHNHLEGSIPKSFSKLKQIESLDLSHNNFSGAIPSELTDLFFLEVFSVAYNNLSGRILPDMKAQFGTFENSSYEGNPFLCGPPLSRSCSSGEASSPPSPTPPPDGDGTDGKWYEIDHEIFIASFSASYFIFFLAVIALLYINPHWQRRLLYCSEDFMYSCYYSCYYFVSDVLRKLPGSCQR